MAKREYIQANKDWLEAKVKEEGVKALPKGIYYKVLSEGNQASAKPTVRSIITAHYTGRTITNGVTEIRIPTGVEYLNVDIKYDEQKHYLFKYPVK